MVAARLHGARDIRVEKLASPAEPGPGQVTLAIRTVGICGSDLHTYTDGRLGETILKSPLIPGHEFAGVVQRLGTGAIDGTGRPLAVGARVCVDPAQACGKCDLCQKGHPNLCRNLHFCGLWPDDGAMCQYINVPGGTCFVMPDSIDLAYGPLLETLGVALHTVDLAKVRVGQSVAIIGAGPIGLCILQVLRLTGADPIYIADKLAPRCELARRWTDKVIDCSAEDPVKFIDRATHGQGVDIAIEAAWADSSIQQAADMLRPGGRLVLVGIPGDDRLQLKHSTARRKGLDIRMVRRMKHVYPRAIQLVQEGKIDLKPLLSHRFPLSRAAEALALNAAYADGAIKVILEIDS